jgi:hypothetical protein
MMLDLIDADRGGGWLPHKPAARGARAARLPGGPAPRRVGWCTGCGGCGSSGTRRPAAHLHLQDLPDQLLAALHLGALHAHLAGACGTSGGGG